MKQGDPRGRSPALRLRLDCPPKAGLAQLPTRCAARARRRWAGDLGWAVSDGGTVRGSIDFKGLRVRIHEALRNWAASTGGALLRSGGKPGWLGATTAGRGRLRSFSALRRGRRRWEFRSCRSRSVRRGWARILGAPAVGRFGRTFTLRATTKDLPTRQGAGRRGFGWPLWVGQFSRSCLGMGGQSGLEFDAAFSGKHSTATGAPVRLTGGVH
ncbi:hypothetical protein SAMN04488094_101729 [Tropicimonas isoalkanivorans]|uniref:Uncharacterized protein n=1 Tax=Tropicimonas isoalkanivorans TaxID=441112 RepID=A0A1I1EFZ0_9RHOB|nr:hypothetical protein SAMN04488094_101729 [Tropicimonas isoalkanivorans]